MRFAAYPWARISLPDGTAFHTPRAQSLTLEPGRYRVAFEHPSFGRAEYTLDLESGDKRVVHHVYEKAPKR